MPGTEAGHDTSGYSAASDVGAADLGIVQVDVEAERTHFLDQHVERFRNTRLERVVAAHDRLVHLGTAGDVVRLHGQHFLQRVRRAVSLERPHFHFAETLAAELRLAAQRLLGDERVRSDRTRVDLVVHEMVQLEHVDVPNRHLAVERVAGPAVIDGRLAGGVEAGKLQHLLDVGFLGAVEHRRRDRHAVAQVAAKLHQFAVVERFDGFVVAVDLLQGLLQRLECPACAA